MKNRFLYGGLFLTSIVLTAIISAQTLAQNDDVDPQADIGLKGAVTQNDDQTRMRMAELRREKRMHIVSLVIQAKNDCGDEFGAGSPEARKCLRDQVKAGILDMVKAIRDERTKCRTDNSDAAPMEEQICVYESVFGKTATSPTPSPIASASPTASASPSATASVSPTATASPSASPTASATASPTATPTATATASPTASASPSASPTATANP